MLDIDISPDDVFRIRDLAKMLGWHEPGVGALIKRHNVPVACVRKPERGVKPTRYFRWADVLLAVNDPAESPLCACGCSGRTRRGNRYLPHHQIISSPVPYLVDPDTGCWIWQRHTNSGYGRLMNPRTGKLTAAHVFYYEQKYGPVPKGKELDHICPHGPNRACCNPDHVEPVTHTINMQRSPLTKLTPDAVRQIRALRGVKMQKEIAEEFNVTPSCVWFVQRGKTWKNVK